LLGPKSTFVTVAASILEKKKNHPSVLQNMHMRAQVTGDRERRIWKGLA
jgi:hypothetical protein